MSSNGSAYVLHIFCKDLSHAFTARTVWVLHEVSSILTETRHGRLILKKPVMIELNYFSYTEKKSAVRHEIYTRIASST